MVESGKCTALVFFCTCVYMLRFAMERAMRIETQYATLLLTELIKQHLGQHILAIC